LLEETTHGHEPTATQPAGGGVFAIHPVIPTDENHRLVVVAVTFIAAVLMLVNWACSGQPPRDRSARPLRFTPGSGPIEGNRLVFIDVEEPAAAIGTASITCRRAVRALLLTAPVHPIRCHVVLPRQSSSRSRQGRRELESSTPHAIEVHPLSDASRAAYGCLR
jgi:hypothetical protein